MIIKFFSNALKVLALSVQYLPFPTLKAPPNPHLIIFQIFHYIKFPAWILSYLWCCLFSPCLQVFFTSNIYWNIFKQIVWCVMQILLPFFFEASRRPILHMEVVIVLGAWLLLFFLVLLHSHNFINYASSLR